MRSTTRAKQQEYQTQTRTDSELCCSSKAKNSLFEWFGPQSLALYDFVVVYLYLKYQSIHKRETPSKPINSLSKV